MPVLEENRDKTPFILSSPEDTATSSHAESSDKQHLDLPGTHKRGNEDVYKEQPAKNQSIPDSYLKPPISPPQRKTRPEYRHDVLVWSNSSRDWIQTKTVVDPKSLHSSCNLVSHTFRAQLEKEFPRPSHSEGFAILKFRTISLDESGNLKLGQIWEAIFLASETTLGFGDLVLGGDFYSIQEESFHSAIERQDKLFEASCQEADLRAQAREKPYGTVKVRPPSSRSAKGEQNAVFGYDIDDLMYQGPRWGEEDVDLAKMVDQ